MKVVNINGTSQNTCKCGGWLAHWEAFSGQTLSKWCSERSCIKAPEVGAHVQKDGSTDKAWYIVPLCNEHNGQTGESLDLVDSVILVSANVSQTCGK
jgi:hypothetical protein